MRYIVLDTNVLLVSISRKSPLHWIFNAFENHQFILCVSTEILLEYEEIISKRMGTAVARNILEAIESAPNVVFATRYYEWNLIHTDPDDNKFVDCAIATNAEFIVTEDKHFNILNQIPFPKVSIYSIDMFKEWLALN